MKLINIAVIGNCQARPIAEYLIHTLHCNVNLLAIVHLLKQDEEKIIEDELQRSDIIISQVISDDYRVNYISTNTLRKKYGSKLITIPNLFYSGYTPDLKYLRLKKAGTLQGPLGDYHSNIIHNSWENGLSINDAIQSYKDINIWRKLYSNTAVESIENLKKREKMTDIIISDVIDNEKSDKQLFFTFNHPSKYLIEKLINRVLNLIKNNTNLKETKFTMDKEPLNQFQVPLSDFVIEELKIKNPITTKFKGMVKVDDKFKKMEYDLEYLTKTFYHVYNENEDLLRERLVR